MTFTLLAASLVLLGAPAAASLEAVSSEHEPPPSATRAASNVVFAEALGNGVLYSVNYERIVEPLHLGLRVGVSYFTYPVSSYGSSGNLKLATFPLVASYYFGTPSHKVQVGLGATILYLGVSTDSQGTKFESERAGVGLAGTAVIGYRYLPHRRGFSFGIGFTPLLRASRFLPWGGANAGFIF